MAALLSCAERWRADSFYAHQHAEDHFRTEPMRSDRVAQALAARIMTAAGPDQPLEVFDIGAGNGALLRGLAQHLPKETAFHGVDIRERPENVPGEWHQQEARDIPPHSPHAMPILICHEFFDDVPCDLVEVDADGHPRLLVVDDDGDAVVGPLLNDPAAGADRHLIRDWIERWWPPARPFIRIEVGRERDALWREFTHKMLGGIAFAIDYGHLLSERLIGTWDAGTVIGWRHGRAVSPRWDGSRNVTAHVAMDALAHAGSAHTSRIYRQRDALHMAPSPVLTTGGSGDYLWLEADLRGAHHE